MSKKRKAIDISQSKFSGEGFWEEGLLECRQGGSAWFGSADSPDKWEFIRRLRRCAQMGFKRGKGNLHPGFLLGSFSGFMIIQWPDERVNNGV
jgi:hypothetical protein